MLYNLYFVDLLLLLLCRIMRLSRIYEQKKKNDNGVRDMCHMYTSPTIQFGATFIYFLSSLDNNCFNLCKYTYFLYIPIFSFFTLIYVSNEIN